MVVENPDIFNQFQNDSYILYRAYGTFQSNEYRILKLDQKSIISGTTITFDDNVNTAASGNLLCTDATLPELYISPYKYWVSMIYNSDSKFGDSNDEHLIPRSYGNVMEVKKIHHLHRVLVHRELLSMNTFIVIIKMQPVKPEVILVFILINGIYQ